MRRSKDIKLATKSIWKGKPQTMCKKKETENRKSRCLDVDVLHNAMQTVIR